MTGPTTRALPDGCLVRPGGPGDAAAIIGLVHELAQYEKAPEAVEMTEADLRGALSGPAPQLRAMVAEERGEMVGMALYFFTFSSWTGKPGLFLVDLFVRLGQRRRGFGRAMFAALASEALDAGCARFEWDVLDWNEPALVFYRSLGAEAKEGWTTYRLSGPALAAVAATASGAT